MAATAVAVTTAAAIMVVAIMVVGITAVVTMAAVITAAIMVEVITAAAITAAIIMVDTTARTGAAMLFIMAHIGAATVTAATGTAAGGGAVTASARAGDGLLPGMFGSATKMINGKPAPAGFPSSQSKSPGLRVCEIRHQTPRGLTPISFQSIRATAADDYPATTAIGVISTMISGTAKLAAVSKVLAGKPLP
jgi:hypothetical protein